MKEKPNILFLSYSDTRFDGRLRELLNVAKELGNVYSVVRFNENTDDRNWILNGKTGISIFEFVNKAKKMAYKMPSVDIVFVDNRMACIPGLVIKKKYTNTKVIQDVRELYILSEQRKLKSKIGCWFEALMMKESELIICANKYRAQKMKDIYQLTSEPIVYENIRKLEYGKGYQKSKYEKKYKQLIQNPTVKVISTSGWDISRTNDKLVEAFAKLQKNVELLMVGGGTEKDRELIENIIKKENINNVHLIGKVQEEELKYLISISKIGIVNYGKYDTNNELCASGKIYEFLFEGIPVVTTENLPLIEFCKVNCVGEADDTYINAIKHVLSNYSLYEENVKKFVRKLDVDNNNKILVNIINESL